MELSSIFRGNITAYFFSKLAFEEAVTVEQRVSALAMLVKSGSPLAVDILLDALNDVSYRVRRIAAIGLGRIGSAKALPFLEAELNDIESDIRPEAAEAMGKIGDISSVDMLALSLLCPDSKIAEASAYALSDIGGEKARAVLMDAFRSDYAIEIFHALADSLSRMGEIEIVDKTMSCLDEFHSPVIRLQLLNSVSRVLGGRDDFYRIVSKEEYGRVVRINDIISESLEFVRSNHLFPSEYSGKMERILGSIVSYYRKDDIKGFTASVWEFMAMVQLILPSGRKDLKPYIRAVNQFLASKRRNDIQNEGMIFLVICLRRLLEAIIPEPGHSPVNALAEGTV